MTEETSEALRDRIAGALDSNDKLLVAPVRSPRSWKNLGERVAAWIKNNPA